jgi:hypothetical protein
MSEMSTVRKACVAKTAAMSEPAAETSSMTATAAATTAGLGNLTR